MESPLSFKQQKCAKKELVDFLRVFLPIYLGMPEMVVVTPWELEKITGCTRHQIKRWRRQGLIRWHYQFGNRILYPLKEVLRLLQLQEEALFAELMVQQLPVLLMDGKEQLFPQGYKGPVIDWPERFPQDDG